MPTKHDGRGKHLRVAGEATRFQPGNELAKGHWFKPGQSGNPKGRPRVGASIREWWNALAAEDENGQPRYTVAEIRAIAEAEDDDQKISVTKRAAARQLLEMAKGGRQGREIAQLVFDRTEGKPGQHIALSTGIDPSVEITEATLARIRAAGNSGLLTDGNQD